MPHPTLHRLSLTSNDLARAFSPRLTMRRAKINDYHFTPPYRCPVTSRKARILAHTKVLSNSSAKSYNNLLNAFLFSWYQISLILIAVSPPSSLLLNSLFPERHISGWSQLQPIESTPQLPNQSIPITTTTRFVPPTESYNMSERTSKRYTVHSRAGGWWLRQRGRGVL